MDCGAFTLWWRVREGSPELPFSGPRVCVIASTAAVGKAVLRNRAKRRLRELFRLHQEKLAPHLDLMLLARSNALRVEFAELEKRFLQACSRMPALGHD